MSNSKPSNSKHCAVVTGGTRGIGYAIADRLVRDGFAVIATGTHADGKCPDGAQYQRVDFMDESSTLDFAEFLKDQNVAVLVNNAGINKIGQFAEIAIQDFDAILRVNLRAPYLLCQAVIPAMKQNRFGRIVNITSIFGHISKEYRAPYSASKFGLDGMTVALAAELAEFGILANSVGPGFTDTDLTRSILGEAGINTLKERIPIKRLAQVDEVAALVSWLVSEENSYLSGQNIMIDGGFTRV
jgi:3-oxoacyl-[acyl-carrier protein] reductase